MNLWDGTSFTVFEVPAMALAAPVYMPAVTVSFAHSSRKELAGRQTPAFNPNPNLHYLAQVSFTRSQSDG